MLSSHSCKTSWTQYPVVFLFLKCGINNIKQDDIISLAIIGSTIVSFIIESQPTHIHVDMDSFQFSFLFFTYGS